jgi:stress response protein YsnF
MMEEPDPVQPSPYTNGDHASKADELAPGEERVIELREEQLVANRQLRDLGKVIVRTEVDSVPARLEVDALHEEVEVVHEPVGQTVAERDEPSEEDGVLVVPIYEEQLVVS